MKRIPWPVAVIVLVVALVFAYNQFMNSFFPRRGQTASGQPPMPEQAKQMKRITVPPTFRNTKKTDEPSSHKESQAEDKQEKSAPTKGGE